MLRNLLRKAMPAERPSLKDFKHRHKGQRCFVIGNGPSLNLMDLGRLAGEILFTSNGIYHLFPNISWRPSYYACVDAVVLRDRAKEITEMRDAHPQIECFFPKSVPDAYARSGHLRVETFLPTQAGTCYFKQTPPQPGTGPAGLFPPRPENGLVQPYTVTATLLQLAHLMGCNPIYLIGCDTLYTKQANVEEVASQRRAGTRIYESSENNDPNHFTPAYFGTGKRYQDPNVHKMVAHYEAIQQVAESLDLAIFNAGTTSHLQVFPKVDFEQLFASGQS